MANILDSFRKWWKEIFQREIPLSPQTKKIFWAAVFVIAISLLLTIDFIPNEFNLDVGRVSQTDIRAPRTINFIDQEKTNQRKELAAQSVRRVYEEDVTVNNNVKERIGDFFSDISEAKNKIIQAQEVQLEQEDNAVEENANSNQEASSGQNNAVQDDAPGNDESSSQESALPQNESVNVESLAQEIKQSYPEISRNTITILFQASLNTIDQLENEAKKIIDDTYQNKFTPEDISEVRDELAEEAMTLDFNREYRLALANILESTIKPNMTFNEEATMQNRKEAREEVDPVTITVRRDEMIVRSGDIVTEEDIKVLEAFGLRKDTVNYLSILGIFITIITLLVLASIYLYKYKNDIWNSNRKLLFLELMILIVLFLAKLIDWIPTSTVSNFYLPYLVPVAIASILITVLIGSEVSIVATIFISFLVALVFNNDYNVAVLGFVSGMVGIFSVTKLSQRNDLVRAGFNVSGVLVVLVLGLRLINPVNSWVSILGHVSMAVANGLIVAILANGLLPYLENLFGLTSSVKLLELSNPTQALLSKMVFEAPGTYNHCLVVANLAETAANNIGADSLLARVGAYYHDIGKMKRPYFFIENHMGRENPHDKLSPNLSALIIKSHVRDGVEMAKEYKLPVQIIDIIKQHHGTNLISYFYQEALKDSKHDSVEESDFRYEGPKPQTKEAAIILLADISEAAVRSKNFNKTNHNRIEGLVRELIKDKLIEGQLDESDLSLRDLDVIVESFVKVLTGIYHQRIDYPENILKEMKRADKIDKDSNK
ncbi:MAG: HD family phosphohydrolase [Halanaerobiales bacterium]